jgi:Flp pilus assembly protein TadD
MDQPQRIMDRCLELVRSDRPEEAVKLASTGLDRFPDEGQLWRFRGLARHRLQDFRGAGDDLETASLLVPLDPAARRALADCHMRAGEKMLARDLYLHLSADPKCPTELLPAVASGLGGLAEYRAALETCRRLLRRDSSRHEAHFGVAYYLRRLGHPLQAIVTHVSRAHELSPATPLYRITLASLYDQAGRGDEARELLQDLDPATLKCPCCLKRVASLFRGLGGAEDTDGA